MLFENKDKQARKFYKDCQQRTLKHEKEIVQKADELRKDKKDTTMTEEEMQNLDSVYYIGYVYCEDGGSHKNYKVLKFVQLYRLSVAHRDTLLSRYEYKMYSFLTGSSTRYDQIVMSIRDFNKTWFTNIVFAYEKVIELIKKGDCPYLNVEPDSLPVDIFGY